MRSLLATSAIALALAIGPALAGDVIMTGGAGGDYLQYFGPPLKKVLFAGAWVDAPVVQSDGTPASLDFLLDNPNSYALAEGNVYAGMATEPKYDGKLRVLTTRDMIGNEAVLAIVSDKFFKLSNGSFASLADHASRVRFVLPPDASGPGYTFKQMQGLDPDGLGKATQVTKVKSIDAAIEAVASGEADATLMVQFANPKNERFIRVHALGLHFMPVAPLAMRDVKLPGDLGPAFGMCVKINVGDKDPMDTACSPILAVTGATNKNPDLTKTFANVKPDDFAPADGWFASVWKKTKAVAGPAAAASWDFASSTAADLAKKANIGQ